MTPLDHGILNVPLNRRGNIDSQLDRYNSEQAKIAAEKRKLDSQSRMTDKAHAKQLYATYLDNLLNRYGAKFGRAALREELDDMCKWKPKSFIALVAKFCDEEEIAAITRNVS